MASCSPLRTIEKDLIERQEGSSHFEGIIVYDLVNNEELLNINGDKYFIPASNVKLFTFYTAWQTLTDSVSAFEIAQRGDSLIIRGNADPGFLLDSTSDPLISLLKESGKNLFLVDRQLEDESYGPGWSWDDYQYAYMPERSSFPVYGNRVKIGKQGDSLVVRPGFFKEKVVIAPDRDHYRDKDKNTFYLSEEDLRKQREIPFKTSNQLVADLLGEALNSKVTLIPPKEDMDFQRFYRAPYDSLYTKMLLDSDNFIAEQLMLQVSLQTEGVFSVSSAIDYALENYLEGIPQKPRWVDGSGLSRYNLFSPADMVYLLKKMHEEIPESKLLAYLPVGGQSGTLKNYFAGDSPYVFAKTGTLSNNFCLSGYLRAKSGKLLAFSYMTNHYQGSSSNRKKEIEDLLSQLRELF